MSASDPELEALETELRRLVPCEDHLRRDLLLFRMGQASGGRSWWWPLAVAAPTLLSLVLAGVLLLQPSPQVIREVAREQVESATNLEIPLVEASYGDELESYRRLQDQLLNQGLQGLGEAPRFEPPPAARNFFTHCAEILRGETNP